MADMLANLFSRPSTGSSNNSRALEITRQAKAVFAAYRKDDFADPDGFVVQLCMVLERYPDAVIATITSPLTGIQRRCKQPPTISDVVAACDGEVTRAARLTCYQDMGEVRRPERIPAYPANLFVPAHVPAYDPMIEWARTADPKLWRVEQAPPGIHVPLWAYRRRNPGAKIYSEGHPPAP